MLHSSALLAEKDFWRSLLFVFFFYFQLNSRVWKQHFIPRGVLVEERGERGSSALPQPGEIKGIDFMGLCGTHWDPEQSIKKNKNCLEITPDKTCVEKGNFVTLVLWPFLNFRQRIKPCFEHFTFSCLKR